MTLVWSMLEKPIQTIWFKHWRRTTTSQKNGKGLNIVDSLSLSLDWDYYKREVHLSMPGYVEKALAYFKHERPNKSQDQPHQHTIPTYGAKIQYAKKEDDSHKLDKNGKQYVQQVFGTFCFYGRAVDCTMLTIRVCHEPHMDFMHPNFWLFMPNMGPVIW